MKEFRVFGPPGTGKTTYLSKQIKRAVDKTDQIMVASFTRAAAIELTGRDLPISKHRIGTLHSFCYRSLGYPEIADTPKWCKKWNELWSNPEWKLSGSKTSVEDPWGFDIVRRSDADAWLQEYSRLRTALIPRERWRSKSVIAFAEHWDAWKRENDLLDFTDLILVCLEKVPRPPFHVDIGFFDEVQDFSPAELALVRKWGSTFERSIVLAGDDDQTIYAFRGSVPDAFLFPGLPEDHIKILGQSYRLPRAIKKLADKWIRGVERRQEKPFEARDEPGSVSPIRGNASMAGEIVKKAYELAGSGESVMILGSCSFMLESAISAMKMEGIPFHNPYRPTNGAWNPWRGGIDRLQNFLTDDIELWGNLTKEHTWKSVWRWFELINTKTAKPNRGAKRYVKMLATDDKSADVPLKPEDWAELGIKPPEGNLEWLQKHILSRHESLMAFPFQVVRKRGIRALAEKPQIVVGTIHSVKGGQAENVILLPDISYAAECEVVEKGRPLRDALRRLWYVGVTRARRRLFVADAMNPGRTVHANV
ncbi:MAG: ATP-dependent helicase [Candidatus Latescibacterota bacterium]|nr:MAG: ATP-dependent helicase [Candidatus Latescibacterota bacterium]